MENRNALESLYDKTGIIRKFVDITLTNNKLFQTADTTMVQNLYYDGNYSFYKYLQSPFSSESIENVDVSQYVTEMLSMEDYFEEYCQSMFA